MITGMLDGLGGMTVNVTRDGTEESKAYDLAPGWRALKGDRITDGGDGQVRYEVLTVETLKNSGRIHVALHGVALDGDGKLVDPAMKVHAVRMLEDKSAPVKAKAVHEEPTEDFESMTVHELRDYAHEHDISLHGASTKAEIIEAITSA